MTRPRLGFNALALQPGGTGVQTYVRELLSAMPDAVDADLVAAVREDSVGELPERVTSLIRLPSRGIRRFLDGARPLGSVDLVHGLDVHIPAQARVPTVSTVHDLSVIDVPSSFPRQRRIGELVALRHAIRRADVLIAVSHFTADRLKRRFGREAVVVHEAPASDMVTPDEDAISQIRRRCDLPQRFVLFVGIGPRKGLDSLVEACRKAEVTLVVSGASRSGGRQTGVRHLGYVDRDKLPALYAAATVFAFPSVYEGFGLPPLEAMACGTAVVATDIPPLREVLGDGAVFVPRRDADMLARAIAALVADKDRRRELVAAGSAHARRFTWAAAAASTRAVYRELGIEC